MKVHKQQNHDRLSFKKIQKEKTTRSIGFKTVVGISLGLKKIKVNHKYKHFTKKPKNK